MASDACLLTFRKEDGLPFPYFRAGSYITVRCKIGDSLVTRPYSICSSPLEARKGFLQVAVKKAGLLSNYLVDEAKEGDRLALSEPCGFFYEEPLRDAEQVVGIAGGSGITPFLAMAKAIKEGSENFRLTIIYGARKESDLLFKKELDGMAEARIKVVYVLSDESKEGYLHGFISEEILRKESTPPCSYFLCGPNAMYRFVIGELAKMGVAGKFIRTEKNKVGDRRMDHPRVFSLLVHIRDERKTVPLYENETVLTALERAGIAALSHCHCGLCGYCHTAVLKGDYTVNAEDEDRRMADSAFHYIHPCCTYPDSDMEIEIPFEEEK